MPRFFAEITGERAVIRGRDAAHISRSLRRGVGDELDIRDRRQGYRALIQRVTASEIVLSIEETCELRERSSRIVHLGICLIATKDMDTLVRFTAELGVCDIQPVISEHSNVRDLTPRRYARWEDIVMEAVKQSQRETVPRVLPPLGLEEFIAVSASSWPVRLVALEGAGPAISDPASDEIGILIGPEGGFTPAEEARLLQAGFVAVHLGRTTLRALTAAVAAVGILAL